MESLQRGKKYWIWDNGQRIGVLLKQFIWGRQKGICRFELACGKKIKIQLNQVIKAVEEVLNGKDN